LEMARGLLGGPGPYSVLSRHSPTVGGSHRPGAPSLLVTASHPAEALSKLLEEAGPQRRVEPALPDRSRVPQKDPLVSVACGSFYLLGPLTRRLKNGKLFSRN
ncbi:MAG: hypothetical protein HY402_00030, partial [Elusimicrobia bacterium]|nr:hypothetical protein [Elusimicrobiota bacterium]